MPFVLGDDFLYRLQFPDEGFIGSVAIDSFQGYCDSLINHYKNYNNRIVPHALLQLVLMLPPVIFDFLNTIIFLALPWCVIRPFLYSSSKQEINLFSTKALALYFSILLFLWCFHYDLGRSYLWTTGSVNYSWFLVLQLSYVGFLYNAFVNNYKFPLALVLTSLLICTTNENVVLSLFAATLCVVFYKKAIEKKQVEVSLIISLCILLLGGLIMLKSPALGLRIENESFQFESLYFKFSEFFKRQFYYCICAIPAFAFFLMYKSKPIHKKAIVFFGSIITIASIVMFMAPLYEPRSSMFAFFVFLMLILSMLDLGGSYKIYLPVFLIVFTILLLPGRIKEVNNSRKRFDNNFTEIDSKKENPKLVLSKFCENYQTNFAVCDELSFDANAFENKSLAAYLGKKKVESNNRIAQKLKGNFIGNFQNEKIDISRFNFRALNKQLTPTVFLTGVYKNENEIIFELRPTTDEFSTNDFGYVLRGVKKGNRRHQLCSILPKEIGKYFLHYLEQETVVLSLRNVYFHSVLETEKYDAFIFALYDMKTHNTIGEHLIIAN